MGYASLSPLSVFEIGNTPLTSEVTLIPGAGSTVGLTDLAIPSWVSGKVKKAYLDVHFPYVKNNHADYNWIDTCSGVQITPDSGLNWYQAIDVPNHTLYLPASVSFMGELRLIGTYDLTAHVESNAGSHWSIQIADAITHDTDLRLFLTYCVLRIYMETQ